MNRTFVLNYLFNLNFMKQLNINSYEYKNYEKIISSFTQDTPVVNDNICIFREPVFSVFTYNFTSLISPTKDAIVNDKRLNVTVRLQLCSALKQKCNGEDGYGICLVKNEKEKGIGSALLYTYV